jgi:GrpB-like predicted nucleotidyltransferase (UPF0157 family)
MGGFVREVATEPTVQTALAGHPASDGKLDCGQAVVHLFSMDSETRFVLVDANRAREEAQRLFEAVSTFLIGALPLTAEVRHIGATAVPGCLTKGDLDIVVRVALDQFAEIDAVLASHFERNKGSIRSETFSAFEDASSKPHLGIQLVAINGPFDFFHLFVEALERSARLVEEYNALKRRHDGANMALYRKAKDAFVEAVLADFICNLKRSRPISPG